MSKRTIIRSSIPRQCGRGVIAVLPYFAALALIALFCSLGLWQLDRAAEKAQLFERFDAAADVEPRAVQGADDLADLPPFTPVAVRVSQWVEPTVLLENRVLDGRPGVHVLRAAEIADGSRVLINLGWVERRPGVALDLPRLPAVGRYQGLRSGLPATGVQLGELPQRAGTNVPVPVPYVTTAWLQDMFGTPISEMVLVTDAADEAFVRRWRPAVMPPERHHGYAAQWFALAGAVFTIAIVLSIRQRRLRRNSVRETS